MVQSLTLLSACAILALCLLHNVACAYGAHNWPISKYLNQSTNTMTKAAIVSHVRSFMNYHLYFSPIVNKPNLDLTYEEMVYLSSYQQEMCLPQDQFNETQPSSVDRCINYLYQVRGISRKQITWKPSSSVNGNKQPPKTTGGSSSSQRQERIHPFLIFALLLPNHPYSHYLEYMLTIIAPLYPQIVFVKGYAVEFADLGSKYNIQSYPHLLFFRNGIPNYEFYDSFLEHYQQDITRLALHHGTDKTKTKPRKKATTSLWASIKAFLPSNMKKMMSFVPVIPSTTPTVLAFPSLTFWPFVSSDPDQPAHHHHLPPAQPKQRLVLYEFNEEVLAIYLSIWTKALPKAIPQKFTALAVVPSYEIVPLERAQRWLQQSQKEVHDFYDGYLLTVWQWFQEHILHPLFLPFSSSSGLLDSNNTTSTSTSTSSNTSSSATSSSSLSSATWSDHVVAWSHGIQQVSFVLCSQGLVWLYTTWPILTTLPYPMPNVEPFLTITSQYASWDRLLYVLSAIYTIIRLYQWLVHSGQQFVQWYQETRHHRLPHMQLLHGVAVNPMPPPPPPPLVPAP